MDAPEPPVVTPVTPPEPRVTTEGFGDWLLSCVAPPEGDEVCEVVQTIQVRGQDRPLAKLALGHLPGEKRLIMTVALPVDVSFSDPVRIHAGDPKKPLALPWVRCLPGACLASAALETKDIDRIRANKGTGEGTVEYVNATQHTISFPLSWRGLDTAITAGETARPGKVACRTRWPLRKRPSLWGDRGQPWGLGSFAESSGNKTVHPSPRRREGEEISFFLLSKIEMTFISRKLYIH